MTKTLLYVLSAIFTASLAHVTSEAAERPDFSGIWTIDHGKSDDAIERVRIGLGDKLARGKKQMMQRYLAEVLVKLAIAAEEVDIKLTEKVIVIFDENNDLTIYYIDGKKHKRQDQDLGEFETVANWQGEELVIESKGKETGEGVETFAMEGEQLVVSVVIKAKHFANDIVATLYYDRVE